MVKARRIESEIAALETTVVSAVMYDAQRQGGAYSRTRMESMVRDALLSMVDLLEEAPSLWDITRTTSGAVVELHSDVVERFSASAWENFSGIPDVELVTGASGVMYYVFPLDLSKLEVKV